MKVPGEQISTLLELTRMGLQQATKVFDTLLPVTIELEAPLIRAGIPSHLRPGSQEGDLNLYQVMMSFNGTAEGDTALVFLRPQAQKLISQLFHQPQIPDTLDTNEVGALTELSNIVLNGVMETLTRVLELHLIYQVPSFRRGGVHLVHPSRGGQEFWTVTAPVDFKVEGQVTSSYLIWFVDPASGSELLDRLEDRKLEQVKP